MASGDDLVVHTEHLIPKGEGRCRRIPAFPKVAGKG
jgi:hypothetical protein